MLGWEIQHLFLTDIFCTRKLIHNKKSQIKKKKNVIRKERIGIIFYNLFVIKKQLKGGKKYE